MKKLLSNLAFLFLLTTILNGQEVNIDSLETALNDTKGVDRVEVLIAISEAYLYENNDSSLYYGQVALRAAEGLNEEIQIAKALSQMGLIYQELYDSQKSLEYLTRARGIYQNLNDQKELCNVNLSLAQNHYYLNNYEQALELISESERIAEEISDRNLQANAKYFKGRVYNRINRGEEALENLLGAVEIWEEMDDKRQLAKALNVLGGYYSNRSDFDNAIKYYDRTLEIRRELGNKRGIGIVLNNLGNQHMQKGNYDRAIDCYREATDIFEEINFTRGRAATLTGMAMIYENLRQYESVLEVYQEVLEIREAEDDHYELANVFSNIAVTYSKMLNDSLIRIYGDDYLDSIYVSEIKPQISYGNLSVEYNLKSFEIRQEIDDIRGISISLANLGILYQSLGEFEKADDYFTRWLELPEDYQNPDTKVAITSGIGRVAMYKEDYTRAIEYFYDAYEAAVSINKKIYIQEVTQYLSKLYERTGNYQQALEYFKEYHEVYDSLNQETTMEQIHEMQVKYETDAKIRENEILRKDQLIQETKLRNTRLALIAVVITVLVFVGLVIQLIRQNNLRKKANRELANKNKLITEQTKEITDSIQYASRIQNAILPPVEYMRELLPEHFTLYRPRDIVSGDYYWITRKGDKIINIVADCTGHGVPGAFMSMLGVAFLNEIISKHEDVTTDFILNELRSQVIHSLHQTGEEGGTQDGMDVCLIIIDTKTRELQYSGANNPLIIMRDDEMTLLKPDKMPIGIHTGPAKEFSRRSFKLQRGDMLYSFSDGYPDQFGGPDGKKFMIRKFKNLLKIIHKLPVDQQKEKLEKTLDEWMENTTQIDDILVQGIRI